MEFYCNSKPTRYCLRLFLKNIYLKILDFIKNEKKKTFEGDVIGERDRDISRWMNDLST